MQKIAINLMWISLAFAAIVVITYKIAFSKKVTGAYGEYLTAKAIKENFNCKIIRNPIIFNSKGESSEIDIIMIHKTGIYVFECKQFSGKIYGKENNFKWYQYYFKKKSSFYNPIMQNKKHIKTLSEKINNERTIYHNVIAFSDKSTLKIEVSDDILINNRTKLIKDIKSRIQLTPPIFTELEIEAIEKKIISFSKFDKKTRKEHIEKIKAH